LQAAETTYLNSVNPPAEGKRYYLKVAKDGHSLNGNAIVIGRQTYPVMSGKYISDQTGFTFNASATPAPYLAQAVQFTQVKDNIYNISFVRDEGTVYMTYGSLNNSKVNWKQSQIQGTTESANKGTFKIVPTSTDNVFRIYNTELNIPIDYQAGGSLYTDTNIESDVFTLEEASQATVTVAAKPGKYGTTILPFTPNIENSNIKFYSCSEVGTETVKLTLVETPPAANTPYIIYNEGTEDYSKNLSGWGTASADSYKVDLLTGVYTTAYVPENSYVLQTQDAGQAFYLVSGTFEATAYKCYLTTTSGVKALFFDTETAIKAVEVENTEDAVIYNLAGQRVSKATKGIYIINGKKVAVK